MASDLRAPALALRGVCARYGSLKVVRDVDLDVARGEVVAVLGPNGAGKTSLVETVAGRVHGSGDIELFGERIDRLPAFQRARRGLSLIPETRGLFRTMSVEENIALGARAIPANERAELIERSLQRFPVLRDRSRQHAGLLSGGEQQMLAFAKAMVMNPSVLILDEPTQGLAPQLFDVLFEVVRRLRDDGVAVVVVEQNYAFAQALADRAIVIAGGQVVRRLDANELATTEDMIEAYMGTATRP